mmetsp:Transcript_21719/g.61596  ORF Transcript_21719/g.61596 Transcript_21719/m.61596 type:complete len:372 (-) Transcript_21719:98-1213(-)
MASSLVKTLMALGLWMCLSITVIFFNAGLLGRFPHPIALVCWHQVVSCMLVATIQLVKPGLLKTGDEANDIPPLTLWRSVELGTPVALMAAIALVASNTAYLYLSVSFIQMVKAWTSSSVYLTGILLGTQKWSVPVAKTLGGITLGLMIASLGEVKFNAWGFSLQVVALLAEAARITMLEVRLKSQGYKLNPLSSMKVFAPLIMCTLAVLLLSTDREALNPDSLAAVGWEPFALNGLVACGLQLAVFLCIQLASGLVYALSGIVKDFLIIIGAAVFRGDRINTTQMVGYVIAVLGLQAYAAVSKAPEAFSKGVVPELCRQLGELLGVLKVPAADGAKDPEELDCIVGASTGAKEEEEALDGEGFATPVSSV